MACRKYSKRRLIFVTAFIVALCLFFSLTAMYVHNKNSMESAQMEQIVLIHANKINNVITKLLYKTQIIEALVIGNGESAEEFERVAGIVLDDPAIRNVLIAPAGIVSKVYPLAGSEDVLGLNFFAQGMGNTEALQAREMGELVLGGPFDMREGGQALVGRLPVYTKDAQGNKVFWGLVGIALNYPEALAETGLDELRNQGYAFEIWRISPDTGERQIIACSDYAYNRNAHYMEKPINIMNAQWQFRISPVKNWYEYPETWILGIGSLLVSLLIAFFAVHDYDLHMMKNELEILTYIDALTGVSNRRGMMVALNKLMYRSGKKLTLCYMDLNKFKLINDTYGHAIGDRVLQQFVAAVSKYTDQKHIFARMGGDEFVLVFDDIDDDAEIDAFFEVIRKDLSRCVIDKNAPDIVIDFSVGKAYYPSQCQGIDDLLRCADSAMYKNKIIAQQGNLPASV